MTGKRSMTAYYNEWDPYAAEWLRELIKRGLIAPGDVDERSITDVEAEELKGYTQHHFFAGIGGWSLALRSAGWPDDRRVLTGSPPCQPFSAAGRRAGYEDERHLAPVWLDLVAALRPAWVFGEQVAAAIKKDDWLDDLLDALEAEGYATGAIVLPACSVGAPHIRQRLWFTANAKRYQQRREKPCSGQTRRVGRVKQSVSWDRFWKSALSEFRAMDDGLPRRVGACDAARNAIVPQVAAEVIMQVMERTE